MIIRTIFNKTRRKKIGEAKLLTSILQKATGLMFCTKVDQPLIFAFNYELSISIHMLFVFCPIDIIFLDKNKKVVEIKENLKPFFFYTSREKAQYFIELEKGTVRKTKTEVGDIIQY